MKHPHPSNNNIAFNLFQCEQLNWLSKLTTAVKTMRGCATFREVAWIFTRQGHLNQVKRTDFVNEELDKAMLKTWRRAALIARTIWPFVSQIRPVWPRGIWIRGNWLVFVYNQLYLLYLHVFVFLAALLALYLHMGRPSGQITSNFLTQRNQRGNLSTAKENSAAMCAL